MSANTNIPWCDFTLNFWEGCTKVSAGCLHCYAAERDKRHLIENVDHWGKGAPRRKVKSAAAQALKWNKKPWICDGCGHALVGRNGNTKSAPSGHYCGVKGCRSTSWHRARVFLGSLMDIFDDEIPIEWFAEAMDMVRQCQDLDWLLVTKRPELFRARVAGAIGHYGKAEERIKICAWLGSWLEGRAPKNVWVITSTENQEMLEKRVPDLLKIPAVVHGLSCEPLLGPLDILSAYPWATGKRDWKRGTFEHLHWVIAGGESGPQSRPMKVEWMHDIQQQCAAAGVAYFAKQLGSFPITDNANLHDWPDETDLVNGCTEGAAAACAELKDKKGGDPSEWPEEMRVRQWPNVIRN